MLVKLIGRWAGPNHNYPAGATIEVDDATGTALIGSKQAEAVSGTPPPTLRADAPETALKGPRRRKGSKVVDAPPAEPISEVLPDEAPEAPQSPGPEPEV